MSDIKPVNKPCPCDGWCSDNALGRPWKTEATHCPRCGEATPSSRSGDVCAKCESEMDNESEGAP